MNLPTGNPGNTWRKQPRTALVAATIAAVATGGAIAMCAAFPSSALAAGSSEKLEWSIDLDCTQCHSAQAEAFEQAGKADESEAAAEKEAVTEETSADERGADATADDEASATATGEASESAGDASASDDADAMTELEGYAAMHVANFDFECSTCHEDSDKLAKAHNKLNSGKEATRLKKTEVTSEVCVTCHDAKDLAEATLEARPDAPAMPSRYSLREYRYVKTPFHYSCPPP